MKKFLLISFFPFFLFSSNIRYLLHNNHAFLMTPNDNLITFEYQKLNNTVDILNLKSQELQGGLAGYASIGDMNGYKLSFIRGFNKFTTYIHVQKQSIQYGEGSLINNNFEIFNRFNILNNYLNKALSIDIGMSINKGKDIVYSDIKFLNSLGHKIDPNLDLIEQNNKYYVLDNNTGSYIILNNQPFIAINDMSDRTLYLKLLKENKISYNTFITYFIKFNKTNITSKITANDELLDNAQKYGYNLHNQILDRQEKSINIGFNISTGTDYVFEFEYYYTKIFRDNDLNTIKYNHVFNIDISKILNRHLFIFGGGKLMYRQFNGEIPYLYNKYTQSTFDHKYGYARFGIGYIF